MTKDIRAVLFDQDGLMFDTERLSAKAWEYAARQYQITVEESFLCTVRGTSAAEAKQAFIEYYGDGIDYDGLRAKKQERFRWDVRTNGLPVKPGLKELLEFLKSRNCRIALATASDQEWSLENLRVAGVRDYFDEYVCGDMVSRCKPDPEIFLAAAGKLSEEPEHCLVLEDSFNGIKAAYAGGFPAVMVPDIAKPDQEMRKMTAAVCDSLLDVMKLLEEETLLRLV